MKKHLEATGRKLILVFIIGFIGQISFAQNRSGTIEFERRTNVYKIHQNSPFFARMEDYLKKNKVKTETFYLHFNDTASVFIAKPVNEEGWGAWLTVKSTTIQDLPKNERTQVIPMWGSNVFLRDSLKKRQWKITYDMRMIAGYKCRKAIYNLNDSTNIYAWYNDEFPVSTGPETFNGLPGTILGLAIEDGSVVYFAKKVTFEKNDISEHFPKIKEKEIKTEAELKAVMLGQMSKMGMKDTEKVVDGMFVW